MEIRYTPAVLFLAVLVALWSVPSWGHEGHHHHVMGTVRSIDAARLEVETTDGKSVTIGLTKETSVFRGKTPAKLADVKKGARVVVETEGTYDKLSAEAIHLPAGTK